MDTHELEPQPRAGRRTGMRRLVTVSLLGLLLAGCGQVGDHPAPRAGDGATGVASVGGCRADSAAVRHAAPVARLGSEQVRLTTDSACPGYLLTGAGATLQALRVHTNSGTLDPGSARALRMGGAWMLAIKELAPRDGYQWHLISRDASGLREIGDSHPVLPFVATDAESAHASTACSKDAVALTEATPHQPPGVAFAWDVFTTTITPTSVGTRTKTTDNVLPQDVPHRFPALAHDRFWVGCGR